MYQMYTLSQYDFNKVLDRSLKVATYQAEVSRRKLPSWESFLNNFVYYGVNTGLFKHYNVDTNEMERKDWDQLISVVIKWYDEKKQGKFSDVFPTPYEMSHVIDRWFNVYKED